MREIIVEKTEFSTIYRWTVESFNARTGNKCKAFKRNNLTAPDFIGEERQVTKPLYRSEDKQINCATAEPRCSATAEKIK